MLSRMAGGDSLETALREAQRLGIAEAQPANDFDGWDAAVKATVLANVIMNARTTPSAVDRQSLGAARMVQAQLELGDNETLKQVVEIVRTGDGVHTTVRLAALPPSDIFAHLTGMETAITLRTDTMQDLTMVEGEGGPEQTAFGVMADLISIARTVRGRNP